MADVLLDDLDEDLLARLEKRAHQHGRTLEAEIRSILESTVASSPMSMEEAHQVAVTWQRRTAGRIQGNSADLIREDRDSR